MSGLAAKQIEGGKLHTIIVLDPAGPLFSIDKPEERVAPTDA